MSDALDRIERFQPQINAFVLVDTEGALAAARAYENACPFATLKEPR